MQTFDRVTMNRGSPLTYVQESLGDLIKKSQSVLLKISSTFPFDLFPDSLVVDENKVSIIHRDFMTEHVHSILIEDITDITVNTSIFFRNSSFNRQQQSPLPHNLHS